LNADKTRTRKESKKIHDTFGKNHSNEKVLKNSMVEKSTEKKKFTGSHLVAKKNLHTIDEINEHHRNEILGTWDSEDI